MAKQVLIVDDDQSLANVLSLSLRRSGYEARIANDGQSALRMAQQYRPDVVILDAMLPAMDGWETCRRLKSRADIPVLMITCRSEEDDVLRSFRAGADDHMRKPFGLSEMKARVKALLRRSHPNEAPAVTQGITLQVNDLTLDMVRCRVSRDDETVNLSPTEFRLLSFLMQNAGRAVSHDELLYHTWGPNHLEERPYLVYYIAFLRRRLGDHADEPKYIDTVRGVGYRFLKGTP